MPNRIDEIEEVIQKVYRNKIMPVASAVSDMKLVKNEKVREIRISTKSDRVVVSGFISGLKGEKKIDMLIDTGATDSLLETGLAGAIGAAMTGRTKRIYGITQNYKDLAEAQVHIRIEDGKEFVSGDVKLSILKGVTEITDGPPILLGMDYLTFERGRQLTLILE